MKGAGGGGGGGTSIDVTAQVGQTIVVKEVDANGKPTAWESADYQERTHGTVIGELLPNTVATFIEEEGIFAIACDFAFIPGRTYTINWNGTPYVCVAFDADGGAVGNLDLLLGTGDTGEPFYIGGSGEGMLFIMPLDGSTEVTVGVSGEVFQKIDKAYLPNDVLYGNTTGYTSGLFDINLWAYREFGIITLASTTTDWEDTGIDKKHYDVLEEVLANQLIFFSDPSSHYVTRAYKNEDSWVLEFRELYCNSGKLIYSDKKLSFRWLEDQQRVQRSCVIMSRWSVQVAREL